MVYLRILLCLTSDDFTSQWGKCLLGVKWWIFESRVIRSQGYNSVIEILEMVIGKYGRTNNCGDGWIVKFPYSNCFFFHSSTASLS